MKRRYSNFYTLALLFTSSLCFAKAGETDCKKDPSRKTLEATVSTIKKLSSTKGHLLMFTVVVHNPSDATILQSRNKEKPDPKAVELREKYIKLAAKRFTDAGCKLTDLSPKNLQGEIMNEHPDSLTDKSINLAFESSNCRNADIPRDTYLCKSSERLIQMKSEDDYEAEPPFFCVTPK